MIEIQFGEIASAIGGELHFCKPETLVSGAVETDSRLIHDGGVFFAKVGEFEDGHDYLAAAINAGAAVAIVSKLNEGLNFPQILVADTVVALSALAANVLERVRKAGILKVVGITGSNGKTSTKNMLLEILALDHKVVAPRDSFNNEVGLPLTVLKLESDTEYLILELGAAGIGSIKALASWTKPDLGIELKVGLAHAGVFGGLEVTAQIKQELMPFISKVAILNMDDPRVRQFEAPKDVAVAGFGYSDDANYRIGATTLSIDGTGFSFRYPNGEVFDIKLKILGEHQVMNAAAALTAADQLGIARDSAIRSISAMDKAERWRMQMIESNEGFHVLNDAYNASPDSMKAALQTLATLGRQGHRTIAVLGQMAELGEFSDQEHDSIGRLVVRYNIDQLFVVGKEAKIIHMAATFEGSWDGESEYFENVTDAIPAIRGKLRKGDVVLVKSSNVAGLRFLGDELAGVK